MQPNVAVIGAGHWGKNLIRVFESMKCLSAVCDLRPSFGASSAEGCRFYDDPRRVFENKDIDAVVIATSSEHHHALAKSAILSGKDVFVEKPMSLSLVEGEELVSLASEHGRILMVGHLLQYHPAIMALNAMVQSGELGELKFLHSQRMNFGRFRENESVLWSFAPHDISLALRLAGNIPLRVFARGMKVMSSTVEDVTTSDMIFDGGMHMSMFVGWVSPVKMQKFTVIGSKKIAVFDDMADEKLRTYRYEYSEGMPLRSNEDVRGEAVKVANDEPLGIECRHFLDCIISRSRPLTDGEEGVRVLRVLDACERSMKADRFVAIP